MAKSNKDLKIFTQESLVMYPSREAETRLVVRKADWNRLKRQLSNVRPEDKLLRTVYSVSFGVAATAAISLLSLNNAEAKPPWTNFAFGFCTLAALVVAVILLCHDRKDTKSGTGDIKLILTDMVEIENSFEQEGQTEMQTEDSLTVMSKNSNEKERLEVIRRAFDSE